MAEPGPKPAVEWRDYSRWIAEAAREYVEAERTADLRRDEATREAWALAREKLAWLVDAERWGWDPDSFVPGG